MTDNLRTRVRGIAAELYPFDGREPNQIIALRTAYVHGCLALADQQPSWGQILDLADGHDTKADKARRFRPEGMGYVMDKAAEVHKDAARRLRALLEGEDR